MTDVPISGVVIVWARKFRGLSEQEAAQKLGWPVEELLAYEAEKLAPNVAKFERLAAVYRLPQATLFLRAPPDTPKMPRDFRTFDGAPPEFSFEFRSALSDIRLLQRNLSNLAEDDEEFPLARLRAYAREKDPWVQGEEERYKLGVTVAQQLSWVANDAFRHWRAVIEQAGVSVYMHKFKKSDCRGLSIMDRDGHPAIVINKSDTFETARIFTLIHEYAHLMIRDPGISDLDYRNATEAFCNRFAAGFLMPVEALREVLPYWTNQPIEWDRDTIRDCALRLKVSQRALALRLEEMGFAPKDFNLRFVWRAKAHEDAEERKRTGGSYVRIRLSDIGGRYTAAITSALTRHVIDAVRASEALGLKVTHFDRAREYVQRQRALASAGR